MNFIRLTLLLFTIFAHAFVNSQSNIENLQVDYMTTPLGTDITSPHFSWQMVPKMGVYGQKQSAYRILVIDENGTFVWDSGKVSSDRSIGIPYTGALLSPEQNILLPSQFGTKTTNLPLTHLGSKLVCSMIA